MMRCCVGMCVRPAEHYPVFACKAKVGTAEVRLVLNLPTCGECKERMHYADIVNEATWSAIESGFRAKGAEVDRLSARLEFVGINSSEGRHMRQAVMLRRQTRSMN